MNEIRKLIQSKLEQIEEIESGVPIPDDVVEISKTYFGYEIQEDFLDSDCDKNYTMQINVTGRLVRKNSTEEDTLKIIDIALSKLKSVFKNMNFKYSYQDITLENGIRKILFTASAKYNEINIRSL